VSTFIDVMVTAGVKGRWAWILGIIAGIILVIVGAAAFHPASVPLIIAGCAIFLFSLVMLIVSFATGGTSD
jgi:hypothetical protein